MSATPPVPAGWYPDPAGSPRSRWWDGTQWTEQFQQPYTTAAAAATLTAPADAKAYNAWIWLVVFLPYISLPFFFAIDFTPWFDYATLADEQAMFDAQIALFTSPAVILATVLGWVGIAGSILFSYRDWKWLQAQGIPKPFHWAWSFTILAGYPVYAIGRAVVTKRRTGHGAGVLWGTIGAFAGTFVVAIVWMVVVFAQAFAAMPFS